MQGRINHWANRRNAKTGSMLKIPKLLMRSRITFQQRTGNVVQGVMVLEDHNMSETESANSTDSKTITISDQQKVN